MILDAAKKIFSLITRVNRYDPTEKNTLFFFNQILLMRQGNYFLNLQEHFPIWKYLAILLITHFFPVFQQ